MRTALRVFALVAVCILASWPGLAPAQPVQPVPPAPVAPPPPPPPPSAPPGFTPGELVNAGHRFFGTVSRGLATVIEKAVSQWGLPNGYVLGEEAGGAFVGGLRYGEGMLYTKNAGDLKVFWQGPSVRLGLRRRRRAHHDASLQPAGHGGHLPAFCRGRRIGLFYRRFRDDSIDGKQYCAGADPVGGRVPIGGQSRLFEIYAAVDLESVLTGSFLARSQWRTANGGSGQDELGASAGMGAVPETIDSAIETGGKQELRS